MKRVIFNQKGGVGKTSITCNLAAQFAKMGRKVLAIDLDPQANTSQYLLGDSYNNVEGTVADFFSELLSFKIFKGSLAAAIHKTAIPGLFVIPSSKDLAELQQKLENRYKIMKLAQALESLVSEEHFDDVFIDTPPSLNFFSMSALIAADSILIPFDCDAFSVKAIHQVMNIVDEVREDHNPHLKVEGIVINQFQSQAKLPQESINSLMQSGLSVLTPYLTHSVAMKESHEKSMPLVFMRSNHKLSQQYQELAGNLLGSRQKKKAGKRNQSLLKGPAEAGL
ncbi:MAG: ParA family protein [Deltaproteobacteria bacterium]|nr:ParA family protein [Deltaproteobacteria bacterium]